MGLDHGPPNFCQKVWFLIMGTMVIIPIWVLIMYPGRDWTTDDDDRQTLEGQT